MSLWDTFNGATTNNILDTWLYNAWSARERGIHGRNISGPSTHLTIVKQNMVLFETLLAFLLVISTIKIVLEKCKCIAHQSTSIIRPLHPLVENVYVDYNCTWRRGCWRWLHQCINVDLQCLVESFFLSLPKETKSSSCWLQPLFFDPFCFVPIVLLLNVVCGCAMYYDESKQD